MRRSVWWWAVALVVLVGCGNDAEPQRDTAAISDALRAWSHDFNDRELDAVCDLFADDVIVVYPQAPDRDHAAFCDGMEAIFADDTRTYSYAEPDIHEVLVDGDLATVRLTWTLTVTDAGGQVLETVVEDGVDVFRRQDEGRWRIHISHAFDV